MSPPEDDRIAPPSRGDGRLPKAEPEPIADRDPEENAEELRSLLDDLRALIEDGRTYLEAELVYQKTRAAFVADRAKAAALFGVAAGVIGFVALIALAVGLIFALTPLLTAWGATALVVVLLAMVALVCVRMAARSWSQIAAALAEEQEGEP